jgi:hypothetical protein
MPDLNERDTLFAEFILEYTPRRRGVQASPVARQIVLIPEDEARDVSLSVE